MPEIVDIDELVPDDIVFKYRGNEYTIPGDLETGQTLELYALLRRLAEAEATGSPTELKRIMANVEKALLPIFQAYQPDMVKLPFGAAGLGVVLRRVLVLIGLLQATQAEGDVPGPPPNRATRRAAEKSRSTRTPMKRGSALTKTAPRKGPAGSRRLKSS